MDKIETSEIKEGMEVFCTGTVTEMKGYVGKMVKIISTDDNYAVIQIMRKKSDLFPMRPRTVNLYEFTFSKPSEQFAKAVLNS